MSSSRFYVLSIGVFLLTSINISAAPEMVCLRNAVWTVDIDPQSLAVETYPADSEISVPISWEQTGLGTITEFSQEDNTVSWRLPARFLTVRFELIDDTLSVEFIQDKRTNDALSVTWPVIEDFESLRGYILPFFEGSYVPKDDVTWRDFLCERGPINTTAGLSMPFWGLHLADRTLTYILTNPFNLNRTICITITIRVSVYRFTRLCFMIR